jgi:hypothetical protein
MFKFEMTIGWLGTSTVTVETSDFDHIEILKEFIEFQEENGWIGNWDAVDSEEDEDGEEETEEEAVAEEAVATE